MTTAKRGRPPLSRSERRTHKVTVVVRSQLRALLQAEADKNGRTISREIELVLELAFGKPQEVIDRIKKGRQLVALVETAPQKRKSSDPPAAEDGRPSTLTVEEAADLLGIGRNAAYDAVKAGTIPTIRIGKRILVLRVPLEKMLRGTP